MRLKLTHNGEYSGFRKRVKRRQEKEGGGGSARRQVMAALGKREVKEGTQEAVTTDVADTPKGENANVPFWEKGRVGGPPIGRGHIGESPSERARKDREMAENERLIREWGKAPDPKGEKEGE